MSLESEIETLTTGVSTLTDTMEDLVDTIAALTLAMSGDKLDTAKVSGTKAADKPATRRARPSSTVAEADVVSEEEQTPSGPRSSGQAKKKKAARKKKAAATRPSQSEDDYFMSLEDLGIQIRPLAQEMGPQQSRIGDIMADQGWAKLSDIPEDSRADFFDSVYRLSLDIKAEAEAASDDADESPSWEG